MTTGAEDLLPALQACGGRGWRSDPSQQPSTHTAAFPIPTPKGTLEKIGKAKAIKLLGQDKLNS